MGNLINLKVERIIIHQIYRRDQENNKINPLRSHEYTIFDDTAMDAFKTRVISALGEGSKAVPMEIVNQDSDGLPYLIDMMAQEDNDKFMTSSYEIAQKLTDSQKTRSIPGGIIVIFSGTKGFPSKKIIGIIKAEIHSAYEKIVDEKTKKISLKFVQEVLLTPGTRLYKTAAFIEKPNPDCSSKDLNEKWSVVVSDYQISQSEGKAAAQYFYSDFLGCGYPETSARVTKKFYDLARSFISHLEVSDSNKSDLLNALITYLKVEQSSIISVSDFGSKYFSIDIQDDFTDYMEKAGLPNTAFTKDVSHIEGKLKFRKINFKNNIKIIAPAEAFKNLVSIETIEGLADTFGSPTPWTKIIIKDKVIKQE